MSISMSMIMITISLLPGTYVHILLPVDIQHTPCPSFFLLETQAVWSQNYKEQKCSKGSRQCNVMPSYWIRQAEHTHASKHQMFGIRQCQQSLT